MSNDDNVVQDGDTEPIPAVRPIPMPRIPEERMAPISGRFLFVDVAAQRAKQLRRGSLPRLSHLQAHPETGLRPDMPPKLERVAMDEVKAGLIEYELPDASGPKEKK